MAGDTSQLTGLLQRAADGDRDAHDDLFKSIYPVLRQLAHRQLAAHRHGTLCTTDLVHEASMRLFGAETLGAFEGRNHLYATAAKAMRQILIDYARQKLAHKRGGDQVRVELDENRIPADALPVQILALEAAMSRLHAVDERGHDVVELKFFGGFTNQEIAEHLGLSDMTIKRVWRKSRAFLYTEMATV